MAGGGADPRRGEGVALRILTRSELSRPNVFAAEPVVRFRLDLGPLDGLTTGRLGAGFVDTVLAGLPGLADHPGVDGSAGGFAAAMRDEDGVPLVRVIERAIAEIQRLAGYEGDVAVTRAVGDGLYDLYLGHDDLGTAVGAWRLARGLIAQALPADVEVDGRPPPGADFARAVDDFLAQVPLWALDQTVRAVIAAAEAQGIPWRRVTEYARHVQLGYGCRVNRVHESFTGSSSYLAAQMSQEKASTSRVLRDAGVPVPPQRLAADADGAVRAAREIGYPVVVKPNDRGKGVGVAVGLVDDDAVRRAFEAARGTGRVALVEGFVAGDDHRLLVVGGTLVAAARRIPGHVVGDGRRTVEELIDEANTDPRRGRGFAKVMVRLELDGQAMRLLGEAGLGPDSVPEAGAVVFLRRTANVSTGGTAEDVTERVHPDIRLAAERAARIVGLDVAGVDFLSPDISRSYREAGGAICEVNCTPGLRPHWIADPGRDVVGPILELMYPLGDDGRIPLALIAGAADGAAVAAAVASILRRAGHVTGLATAEGVAIDDQEIETGALAGMRGARMVLDDPVVEAAVLEATPADIVAHGLAVDRCDAALVRGFGADGDEAAAIDLAVGAARRTLVLEADDPEMARLRAGAAAERVCLVAAGPAGDAVRAHVAAGGSAVTVEAEAELVFDDGGGRVVLARFAKHVAGDVARRTALAAALALGVGVAAEHVAGEVAAAGR